MVDALGRLRPRAVDVPGVGTVSGTVNVGLIQGGTAYNDAVAAAFSAILDKEIIVPPHNGVIGALGMALLARERMPRTGEPTTFRGWDLDEGD